MSEKALPERSPRDRAVRLVDLWVSTYCSIDGITLTQGAMLNLANMISSEIALTLREQEARIAELLLGVRRAICPRCADGWRISSIGETGDPIQHAGPNGEIDSCYAAETFLGTEPDASGPLADWVSSAIKGQLDWREARIEALEAALRDGVKDLWGRCQKHARNAEQAFGDPVAAGVQQYAADRLSEAGAELQERARAALEHREKDPPR